jgi:hypothetical protein
MHLNAHQRHNLKHVAANWQATVRSTMFAESIVPQLHRQRKRTTKSQKSQSFWDEQNKEKN